MDSSQNDQLSLEGTSDSQLITCVECGSRLAAPARWMWLRCPACGSLGYPDRSGRNLLSVDWDCLACGAHNSGLTNFCLECGAGLSSRCLRCEAPVYTAICSQCGSHQERLLRLQSVEAERAAWTPILLTQVEQSRQPIETRLEGSRLTKQERRRLRREQREALRRQSRELVQQPRRSSRIPSWALIWIVVGLLMLAWEFRTGLAQAASSAAQALQASSGIAELAQTVQAWWAGFLPALTGLSTDSPEYLYLFASAAFGLATIPIALYLIHRLLQRLFP